MSFTSVLKAIENDVLKAGAIVAQIEGWEPVANALITAVSPKVGSAVQAVESAVQPKLDLTFTDLTNIVKQVQVTGTQAGLSNLQKIAQEAALAGQLLQTFNHITDKNIGDPAALTTAIQALMQAVVDIQNSLKKNS